MKLFRWVAVLVGSLLLLIVIVVSSGVLPVKASSGHWPITAWGLEFAMERSVATHSLGITAPPLDNEALVTRGAAHFEVGCAWCHNRPGSEPGRIVTHMTPHPSNLDEELSKWSPAELFFIVRHGVKFTGMPGWPAERREDEVWGVVAFLLRYQALTASDYDKLSGRLETQRADQANRHGAAIPEVVVQRCVTCHGIDGQGRAAFPSLAGQKKAYLRQALESYRAGQRPSGTMAPLAESISDDEIDLAAGYFSQLAPATQSVTLPDALHEAAMTLVREGDQHKRAGACQACHPLSSQSAESIVADVYPNLNGQRVDYLMNQLVLFRAKVRGGGPRHHIMHKIAEELSDEQIEQVARLYSSQKPLK